MIKKTIITILAFMLLTITVNADDTKTVSFKANYDGTSFSIVEDEIKSEVDNSDLIVNVIKRVDDVDTTIYSGKLGEYENGVWKNTDFSEIQFLVIFDWETDDQTYIIPKQTDSMKNESTEEKQKVDSISNDIVPSTKNETEMQKLSDSTIEINKFVSNEINSDNMMLNSVIKNNSVTELIEYTISYSIDQNNNTVSVNYSVYNGYTTAKTVSLIAALYTDKKLNKSATQTLSISASSADTDTITLPITDFENQSIKLMVWDSINTLRPIGKAKVLKDIEPYNREKHIYVTSNTDNEFKLYMNAENSKGSNNDDVHSISYDVTKLQPIDLCLFTYEKELTSGIINNSGIIIDSVDLTNGIINYRFTNNFTKRYTGINNIIKFKALENVSNEEITYTIQ